MPAPTSKTETTKVNVTWNGKKNWFLLNSKLNTFIKWRCSEQVQNMTKYRLKWAAVTVDCRLSFLFMCWWMLDYNFNSRLFTGFLNLNFILIITILIPIISYSTLSIWKLFITAYTWSISSKLWHSTFWSCWCSPFLVVIFAELGIMNINISLQTDYITAIVKIKIIIPAKMKWSWTFHKQFIKRK